MGEPTFDSSEGHGEPGPVIRDRRRLDPETGQLRDSFRDDAAAPAQPDGVEELGSAEAGPSSAAEAEGVALDAILADLDAAQASAAERLSDLQRLQAEFVNY